MNESLADIEALALRCRSEQSKSYISEAVLCYRTGAYRATIVSTWIAVIFDLVDKIRELSLANDPIGRALWQRYENYIQQIENGNAQGIKNALEFERELISICRRDLQFFDQQQIVDLERLREDRHRCAHPSFQRAGEPYLPTAEQARLHLANAVAYVLSQPPVQGKAQLAQLMTLVSSGYFPLDAAQASVQLRASSFGRANDALINGFVDMIVFDYFKSNSPLYGKPQAASALDAALDMYRPQVESRLVRQFNRILRDAADAELSQAVLLIAKVSTSWGILQPPGREKIRQYIRNTSNMLVLPNLTALKNIPDLLVLIEEKISTMDVAELSAAISTFGLGSLSKVRALELVSSARSFVAANGAISQLIYPLFESFSKEDFETLIQFPRTHNADLPGAGAYTGLIRRIRESTLFEQVELNNLLENNHAGWMIVEVQ